MARRDIARAAELVEEALNLVDYLAVAYAFPKEGLRDVYDLEEVLLEARGILAGLTSNSRRRRA